MEYLIWLLPLAVLLLLIVVAYVRLGWREERELEVQFGEDYRAYRRRVPGFVPVLGTPRIERALNTRPKRGHAAMPEGRRLR